MNVLTTCLLLVGLGLVSSQECDIVSLRKQLLGGKIDLKQFTAMYGECFDPSGPHGFQPSCEYAAPVTQAVAKIDNQGSITGMDGNSIDFHITGVVSFQRINHRQTKIVGVFRGVSAFYSDSNEFSLHVHQKGETNPSCSSTGGHFDPCKKDHSDDPKAENRHIGDVAKVKFNKGDDKIVIEVIDTQVKLTGPLSVLGRSVTIHAGASSARVGCAPITVTEWENGDRHPDTLTI